MPNQLIFGGNDEECGKDIIFCVPPAGMVLQVVYFALDTCIMPSCPNLFAVCH